MPCLDDDLVDRLVRGELGADALASVDEHLDACGDCRALVAIVARGSAAPGAELALARGATVGRYVIGDEVGGGAMGVVYAAWDPELDRRVALKVLREVGAKERVVREAQAMARLAHPNVVTVHEVGTEGDRVWVAMELVAGKTLRAWQGRDWREVCDVMVQVGKGLAAAHAAGVVHRDVKPENVIVGEDGRARVGDFGLAREQPGTSTGTGTGTGTAGTPAYMAPEVLRGAAADARSDQFAYCLTFWEVLHGTRSRDRVESRGPAWLGAILRKGLSERPEERWASIDEMLAAIARKRQARRWVGVAIGAVAASAVTAAVLIAQRPAAPAAAAVGRSCDAGEARIAEVWNDATRTKVRAALYAAGGYGEDVAARVIAAIDGWTQAWAGAADGVCRAGVEEEVRTRCLDRRARDLGALVDRLGAADGEAAQRAVDAVGALAAPAECAGMGAGEADPLPADPEKRAAVDQAEQAIGVANASLAVGDWTRALGETEALVAVAERAGHQPTIAEAQWVRAEALRMAARSVDADAAAKASLWAAERGHDDVAAARAWIELAALAGERRDLDAAEERANHAAAALDRAGAPAAMVAALESTRGLVAYNRGDLDTADRLLSSALARRKEQFGEDDVEVARALTSLAAVARVRGKLADARADLERALDIDRRRLGDRHPAIARDLHNLAGVLRLAGDLDGALERYQQALALARAALGEEQPQTALTHNSIGLVLLARGDLDGAAREMETARAVLDRLGHGDRAIALHNLGLVAQARGQHRAALRYFDQALAVYRTTIGEDADAPRRLRADRARSQRAIAKKPPPPPPPAEKPKQDVGVYGSGQIWP